jgi:F-type H+-transporting ATPase subunit a
MIMSALGILTGMIQAYIFAILATVYIAAATQDTQRKKIQF